MVTGLESNYIIIHMNIIYIKTIKAKQQIAHVNRSYQIYNEKEI